MLLGILSISGSAAQAADTRVLHWTSWNTTISNIDTTNNLFHVTETQILSIETGPFNGGDRTIPLDRITSIDNIKVFDGANPLQYVVGVV